MNSSFGLHLFYKFSIFETLFSLALKFWGLRKILGGPLWNSAIFLRVWHLEKFLGATLAQHPVTQIVRKKFKNSKSEKTSIFTKLKNLNYDQTQKLKLWEEKNTNNNKKFLGKFGFGEDPSPFPFWKDFFFFCGMASLRETPCTTVFVFVNHVLVFSRVVVVVNISQTWFSGVTGHQFLGIVPRPPFTTQVLWCTLCVPQFIVAVITPLASTSFSSCGIAGTK